MLQEVVEIGAATYPIKWVKKYNFSPRCMVMHRISQHQRCVEEVFSSDFVPIKNAVPGLYLKVHRGSDIHYIHETEISFMRPFLARYVEKIGETIRESTEIKESQYYVMSYAYQVLVEILPDWVKISERSIVNHIRHYHSNYEQVLFSMRQTGTYSYARYLDVFVWFNCEIGKHYPDLMDECQRQIEEKLGNAS